MLQHFSLCCDKKSQTQCLSLPSTSWHGAAYKWEVFNPTLVTEWVLGSTRKMVMLQTRFCSEDFGTLCGVTTSPLALLLATSGKDYPASLSSLSPKICSQPQVSWFVSVIHEVIYSNWFLRLNFIFLNFWAARSAPVQMFTLTFSLQLKDILWALIFWILYLTVKVKDCVYLLHLFNAAKRLF